MLSWVPVSQYYYCMKGRWRTLHRPAYFTWQRQPEHTWDGSSNWLSTVVIHIWMTTEAPMQVGVPVLEVSPTKYTVTKVWHGMPLVSSWQIDEHSGHIQGAMEVKKNRNMPMYTSRASCSKMNFLCCSRTIYCPALIRIVAIHCSNICI